MTRRPVVYLQISRMIRVPTALHRMVQTRPRAWAPILAPSDRLLIAVEAKTPVSKAPTRPPAPCRPKASRLSSYLSSFFSQTDET
ncbi:hypothetical protein D3C75_1236420 [compost metagenome]